MNKKQKKMLTRIVIAAAMLIALHFLPVTGLVRLALYLAAYLVIGYDILRKAWKGILNGRVFDENFLMAIATVGAFALAIYEKSGDYTEAISVMLFYTPISSATASWRRSIPMRSRLAAQSSFSRAKRCRLTALY